MCQLLVILKEEGQVLIADVDIRIATEPPVFFFRLATTAEPMAVDLILDLILCIAHVYARVDVRRTHFCLWALQSREEFRMQQGRLGILQLMRYVTSKAEIRVLVDSTRDKARDIRLGAKDLRERVGERWCSLNRAEVYLSDVVPGKRVWRRSERQI